MKDGLTLLLFRNPEVYWAGALITFPRKKNLALLCYLAVTGRAHSRLSLAELLWPEKEEGSARRYLSKALSELNTLKVGTSAVVSPYLDITPETVAFKQAKPNYWLDVKDFKTKLQQASEADIELTEQAIKLYRGDFLEGFYLHGTFEFEQWVLVQKIQLRELALQGLHRLAVYYASRGDAGREAAIHYVNQLLALEPLHEEAHYQKILLLAKSGQRSAALDQYKLCHKILGEELGIEPGQETTRLYELIRDGKFESRAGVATPALAPFHHFPHQSTPFIGRTEEVTAVITSLKDPDCRLLTLVGPGGIGKTRLASQAAKKVEDFLDGVYFISFVSISSADFLVAAIADALHLSLYGQNDPKQHLLHHLATQEMLLVMDNFEHLRLGGAELLAEILQSTQNVKILVTSRERLNLPSEWVFDVAGLAIPDRATSDIENYSAVQLFVQSAHRMSSDFALSKMLNPAVVRICELVDGTPLAIEHAASWVRTLSCAEIAEEIEKRSDILKTTLSVPERHRSMKVVFDHSWKLLSSEEKEACQKLAIFRGGFLREAAEQVADANLDLLSALVDKSFLRKTPSGRYEMHELVRQYAEEKLNAVADQKQAVQDRHCSYFAAFIKQREQRILWKDQKKAVSEINVALDNVRMAWWWAIRQARIPDLEKFLKGMWSYYEERGRFQEGADLFLSAKEEWKKRTEAAQDIAVVRAKLTLWYATFVFRVGRPQEARELFMESRSVFRTLNIRHELAFTSLGMGIISCRERKLEEAEQLLQEALQLYEENGDDWGRGATPLYLGEVARQRGLYQQAEEYYLRSLAMAEQGGSHRGKGLCLKCLGDIAYDLREADKASRYYQKGLEIAEEIGDQWIIADTRNKLGVIACIREEYQLSRQHFAEALRIATEIHTNLPVALDVLVGLCYLLLKEGAAECVVEILTFAIQQPSTTEDTKDKARALLAELQFALSPEVFHAAEFKGKTKSLTAIVAEVSAN